MARRGKRLAKRKWSYAPTARAGDSLRESAHRAREEKRRG